MGAQQAVGYFFAAPASPMGAPALDGAAFVPSAAFLALGGAAAAPLKALPFTVRPWAEY